MLGFPGEDYTTPQTIQATGGFGDPADRPSGSSGSRWALDRTVALGLTDLMLHAGFLPEPGDPDRSAFLDTLAQAGQLAAEKGVTLAFETGQETADLLRRTLDDLKAPNLKVNFDPANMLLYDMGDPIRAVEILGPDIRSVHVKDAQRPTVPGAVGRGSPARRGRGRHPGVRAGRSKRVGYTGPLSSSARSATRPTGSATSPPGSRCCEAASLREPRTRSGRLARGWPDGRDP